MFVIISEAGTGPLVRLHGKINANVYKEMLKKRVEPNLRNAINQPAVFMQDKAPCNTAKSVKPLFLRRILLLWSGLLKAQSWILLRRFGSYQTKQLRKRIQEISKNYWLIWKENGWKYTLMNGRDSFARVAKYVKLLLKITFYTSSMNEL